MHIPKCLIFDFHRIIELSGGSREREPRISREAASDEVVASYQRHSINQNCACGWRPRLNIDSKQDVTHVTSWHLTEQFNVAAV